MRTVKKLLALILSIVLIMGIISIGTKIAYKIIYPKKYEYRISYAAEKFGIEPALIYSIIKNESNFKEDARSHAQAIGLMQIVPDTFTWLKTLNEDLPQATANELTNPDINIMYGSFYLSYLLDMFKDEDVAIAAYNAGPGNVNKWLLDSRYSDDGKTLKEIPFFETNKYVKKVNEAKKIYIDLYFDNNN